MHVVFRGAQTQQTLRLPKPAYLGVYLLGAGWGRPTVTGSH